MAGIVLNSEYIKSVIKSSGKTLNEVSESMGYDKSYLSGILCGKQSATKPIVKMLSMVLGIPEAELIFEPEPTPASDPVGKAVFRPVAPEQMDALIGAINSQVEVLDRLYTMLDTKLDGIVSLGIPIGRLNNNFYDFAVSQGMPDTRPRRRNVEEN